MKKHFFPRLAGFAFLALAVFAVCLSSNCFASCATDASDCIKDGNEAVKNGNTDKAIVFYEKAATLNPKALNATIGLGHLYGMKGDTKKAIEYFEKAIAMDVKAPAGYFGLGNLYLQTGDKASAEKQQKILSGLDEKLAQELQTKIETSKI